MSTRNRIPPLLEAFIQLPPEASLLLLTGVVNATPHWVVTRFLSRFLGQSAGAHSGSNEDENATNDDHKDDVAVVLVSWMRDYEFWKTEARRGAGIDLARRATEKRFAFVDGLSNLFGSTTVATPKTVQTLPVRNTSTSARSTPIPQRGPAPVRGPPAKSAGPATQPTATPSTTPSQASPSTTSSNPGLSTLSSPALASALSLITAAISSLQASPDSSDHEKPPKKIFLILDAPTLLLATIPDFSPADLSSFILSLRSQVHSTLLTSEADSPLIAAAAPDAFFSAGDYLKGGAATDSEGRVTPLETNHAAFMVGQAYQARWVMSLRGLETGVARDVSGVVSVRRGGGWDAEGGDEGSVASNADEKKGISGGKNGRGGEGEGKEMEALYRVAMDGSVKVFERGAGDVG